MEEGFSSKKKPRLKVKEFTLDARVLEGSITHIVIRDHLNAQLNQWGITRSGYTPIFITTDRGSNMGKACKEEPGLVWLVCLSHVLHR